MVPKKLFGLTRSQKRITLYSSVLFSMLTCRVVANIGYLVHLHVCTSAAALVERQSFVTEIFLLILPLIY